MPPEHLRQCFVSFCSLILVSRFSFITDCDPTNAFTCTHWVIVAGRKLMAFALQAGFAVILQLPWAIHLLGRPTLPCRSSFHRPFYGSLGSLYLDMLSQLVLTRSCCSPLVSSTWLASALGLHAIAESQCRVLAFECESFGLLRASTVKLRWIGPLGNVLSFSTLLD